MVKLIITVPKDSVIDHYLYKHPGFTMTENSLEMVVYSYGWYLPPLTEILVLLSKFEPKQYTISKSLFCFSFAVWQLH